MFTPVERMIAWRYLRSRRQEGFVSVIAGFSFLGILLGVATLIIVMAVMNGFKEQLMNQILGFNGEVTVYGEQGTLRDYRPLVDRIQRIKGVRQAFPLIEQQAVVAAHGRAVGVKVHGLEPVDLCRRALLSSKIQEGVLAPEGEEAENTVVLGTKLAKALRVKVGERVTLISPQGNPTPFGVMPKQGRYKVGALFEVGMIEYDRSFLFLPLKEAQRFFNLPEAINGIEVFLESSSSLDLIQQDILRLGEVRTVDWRQANQTFFNAVEVERNVMFIILTLIILIATFNIISNLIMLVKDKSRDIGILRTMGATQGTIMKIFFLTGASIGVAGTGGGFLVGYGFARNIETIRQWLEGLSGTNLFSAEIYFLSKLPAVVRPLDVILVVGMSLLLSFLATLYPSWRAARLNPVEALRDGT